jgi:imidazolonepropionase-like amidohydrolase
MSRLAFTGARLLDGMHPSQPDTTVVVEDDRVVAVGPRAGIDVAECEQVELAGKTIMPGMVICHYHSQFGHFTGSGARHGFYVGSERPPGVLFAVAMDSVRKTLLSGYTGIVSAGCSDQADAQLKQAIEEGICVGPRIRPAGHILETTGYEAETVPYFRKVGHTGTFRFADGADEFRKLTRQEIARGAEIIKLQPTGGHGYPASSGQGSTGAAESLQPPKRITKMRPEEIQAVIEAAHDKECKVRAHVSWSETIKLCVRLGLDVVDHGDEMDREALELMGERGTAWVPSLVFLRRLIDNEDAPQAKRDAVRRDYDNVCDLISYADQLGVKVVTGDDWGLGGLGMDHEIGAYPEELELMVRDAGVSPLDAIRFVTVNGGHLLGAPGAGRVEAGSLADLLVVDADPSTDISVLRKADNIKLIMKGGVAVKDDLVLPLSGQRPGGSDRA